MTGKAEKYFSALARCWPPHPEWADIPPFLIFAFRTLTYSIKHWRSRMSEGIAMIIGTRYWPPQPRSGRAVAEPSGPEKNMQSETNKSAIIFA
jgi:hypothetical protein